MLRQTCLIAILAQIGSYVPAESCRLTPIDCIFTRLGASDRILLGQSTFFVEVSSVCAVLNACDRASALQIYSVTTPNSESDNILLFHFFYSQQRRPQRFVEQRDEAWSLWVSQLEVLIRISQYSSCIQLLIFTSVLIVFFSSFCFSSDELGRGTSTFDGTAIASATVKHLVERSQCLSLFATHYHSLLDEWRNAPKVRLGHMQCIVDDENDDTESSISNSNITFLYTLGPGSCPKVSSILSTNDRFGLIGILQKPSTIQQQIH